MPKLEALISTLLKWKPGRKPAEPHWDGEATPVFRAGLFLRLGATEMITRAADLKGGNRIRVSPCADFLSASLLNDPDHKTDTRSPIEIATHADPTHAA